MRLIKQYFGIGFVAVLLAITALVWYAVFSEEREGLLVGFLNVGQGDAIFIQAPNGNQVLVDAGPNKAVLRELAKLMPFYDRSIDVVVATHPDVDHIGGLPKVLESFHIDLVIEPGVGSDHPAYIEFEKMIQEKDINKVLARRGMRVALDQDAYLLVLFPDRDVAGLNSNDASIVAKLVYGNTSFLFTGDSPKKIEDYLISLSPESIDADVLKIGHHGSRNSTSESFVGYASPDYAVISVGKDNHYGHPHKEVLDILENFGVQIFRTDELGTIVMESNGEDIVLK